MQFSKNTFLSATLALVTVIVAACGGSIDSSIGGTVSGLNGGTVVLINTINGDTVSVNSNTTFTFPTTVPENAQYNVTVLTNPISQSCSVTNGTGTISSTGGNVDNIQVTCVTASDTPVPVYVTVFGLRSDGTVVLLLNTFTSHLLSVNGAGATTGLAFADTLAPGKAYMVTVAQPATNGQNCQPQNTGTGAGSGNIMTNSSGAGISPTVIISCQ